MKEVVALRYGDRKALVGSLLLIALASEIVALLLRHRSSSLRVMQHRLEGPEEKVKRAEKHIIELDTAVRAFLDTRPYGLVIDDQLHLGHHTYRATVREDPPLAIATILGDVFYNLRSALDLLACQLARAERPDDACAHTAFPISESLEEFESSGIRKVEGASEDALNILRATEPYAGRNDALWRLHHLNRFDKHRLLASVGAALRDTSVDLSGGLWRHFLEVDPTLSEPRVTTASYDRHYPLHDGDVLLVVNTSADYQPQFTFEIAFGQGIYAEGESVLDTAHELFRATDAVLNAFVRILGPRQWKPSGG